MALPTKDLPLRALVGLLAAGALALWIATGAPTWKGQPAYEPSGPLIALALSAAAVAATVAVGRMALRGPSWGDLLLATAGLTVLRLTATSLFPVIDDEAYYWLWSRKLELAYYDHPGMVAWLTRLVVPFDAPSATAVRAAPVLFGAALPLATYGFARDLGRPAREAASAGLLVLLLPLMAVYSFLSPHPLLWLFWLLALWTSWRAFSKDRWADWLGAGLMTGAALNCNFTAVLLPLSLLLYLLTTGDRRHLLRPRVWCAALVLVATLLPLLVWNARHGWDTFAFNLTRRHSGMSFQPAWLGTFALQLTMLASPAVVAWAVVRGTGAVCRAWRSEDRAVLLLAWSALVSMTFLAGAVALIEPRHVYSGSVVAPLAILFVLAVQAQGAWLRAAVVGATGLTAVFFSLPPLLAYLPRDTMVKAVSDEIARDVSAGFGWPALAEFLATEGHFGHDTPQVLVTAAYTQASLATYYAASVDFAYCHDPSANPYGRHYRQWGTLDDLPAGQDALLLFIGEPYADSNLAELRTAFAEIEPLVLPDDPALEAFELYRARDWRGWPPR